jgi:release factor glutamine methyltransferase
MVTMRVILTSTPSPLMTSPLKIQTVLLQAASQLKAYSPEPESAAFEAQLLLRHVLKVNRAWLIAHGDEVLEASHHAEFATMLARRLAGEPMAYILGEREFFGLNLKVTSDTLIPRPDTETLVVAALEKITSASFRRKSESSDANLQHAQSIQALDSDLPRNDRQKNAADLNKELSVLDLGTGTGAIALAIAKHCPLAQVTAVDAASGALAVAIENAQRLNIHNVQFVLSHWFAALSTQRFDIIVSNPPYIEADDIHLSQGDVRFEPRSALVAGQDGLDDIRHIVTHAPQHLKPQGWLLFEHGYNQAQAVAQLMQAAGFVQVQHAVDLAGVKRVTLGMLDP